MIKTSPQAVARKIDEWIVRLNELYGTIDKWLLTVPHDRVKHGRLKQYVERPMRENKIPPRYLPTYSVYRGRTKVTFVPSVLWMPGANGRVNITTGVRQHILVDRSEDDLIAKWRLVTEDFHRPLVLFNKTRFLELLSEGE